MLYPLMLDLIRWAKRSECLWFDMGGIPLNSASSDDPRAGNADFKRRFSKIDAQVGSEGVLEPHSGRVRLAAGVRSLANLRNSIRSRER